MKKGIFTVTQKLIKSFKQSINEYRNIDKYGFPYYKKIKIISRFPKVISM